VIEKKSNWNKLHCSINNQSNINDEIQRKKITKNAIVMNKNEKETSKKKKAQSLKLGKPRVLGSP
jgi:hypothetical protein